MHRYLPEFEFRFNHRITLGFNGDDRTLAAVKDAKGQRLTYRQHHEPRFYLRCEAASTLAEKEAARQQAPKPERMSLHWPHEAANA